MSAAENQYVPNELLSRLVGQRMYSVEFVLNDYVQFRFDGDESPGHVTFNSYVWPVVQQDGRLWREQDLGYADALRRLAPGTVVSTTEKTDEGIRIELGTGVIVIHPAREEVFVEIAELRLPGWTLDGLAPRRGQLRRPRVTAE